MLLILEIILTIIAWNRGWKAKSLLPLAIGVGAGFAMGFIGYFAGMDVQTIITAAFAIDAVMIVALITMVGTGREVDVKPVIRVDGKTF